MLTSCDSILNIEGSSKLDYFPLKTGNKWIYELDENGTIYTQVIEVTGKSDDYFTLTIKVSSDATNEATSESDETSYPIGGDVYSASYQVKNDKRKLISKNNEIIISQDTETFNSTTMLWLFETYYDPADFAKQLSFTGTSEKLTCEFVGKPSNTYNCSYIFSETFEKEIGLVSWIDQKSFNNPFWGLMVDTRRGTLISATIDGEEIKY